MALIVSPDVWEGGVRALSRGQMRDIYEGRVTNWKDVGGPDRRIVFFNKEPGRGTWEVFAHWLYGDPKKAPQVSFREVGANEEARNKVASTRGAMSQLSASWADGKAVFALALKDDAGAAVEPTNANIKAGRYPMSRPLFLITNGPPQGDAKAFVDFVLEPPGSGPRAQTRLPGRGRAGGRGGKVSSASRPPGSLQLRLLRERLAVAAFLVGLAGLFAWQSGPVWRQYGLGYLTGTGGSSGCRSSAPRRWSTGPSRWPPWPWSSRPRWPWGRPCSPPNTSGHGRGWL